MAKKATKAAAAAIQITDPCTRDFDGYGALPFIQHDDFIVTRSAVSSLKAQILKAGFEAHEISLSEWLQEHPEADKVCERWDADFDLQPWKPEADPCWTQIAVLLLRQDGQGVDDAVAILARPAGMADQVPEDKPWPFPKGEGGGPPWRSRAC